MSVGGGHRPRRSLLVVAHAVSGCGLLAATALGVEALGRVVTDLDPRIDIGHAVTCSRREWSQSVDRYRLRRERTRSPARRGGAE